MKLKDIHLKQKEPTEERMDGAKIGRQLAPDSVEIKELGEQQLRAVIKDMSEDARQRVVFNSSGGLPGPPTPPVPSVTRRLMEWIFGVR